MKNNILKLGVKLSRVGAKTVVGSRQKVGCKNLGDGCLIGISVYEIDGDLTAQLYLDANCTQKTNCG
ncbi:MAG: hypothetical protein QM539_10790 [Alphaproteobacteria bacterium]|nr:hypothetical protein [Alphaproteobacteria bacterium]